MAIGSPKRALIGAAIALVCVANAPAGTLGIRVSSLSVPATPLYSSFPVSLSWNLSGSGMDLPGGLQYVTLDLIREGAVARSFTIWPGEPGAVAGENVVTLAPEELPPPGTYSVRVSATGSDVTGTAFFRVSNPSRADLMFSTPRGVDVNRVAGSAHFGRVYVSEATGGAAGSRTTVEGVYVLNPDLSPAFPAPRATSPLIGSLGPWGTSVYSPHRLTVDNEGTVYICDASDAHSALFVADPDVSDVKALLAYPYPPGGSRTSGGLVSTSSGTRIYGSVCSVWAGVSDGTRTVMTCDEDLSPANSVWKRTLPVTAMEDASSPALFASYASVPWTQDLTVGSGGVYVVSTSTNDARLYDSAGNLLRTLPPNGVSYSAICLDEERGSAYLSTTEGRIFRASPDFTASSAVINGLGAQVTDVACDADGWLYATNATTQRLDVFAPAGDLTVQGSVVEAPDALNIIPPPLPGDIAPVGPEGLHQGANGQRFGDGVVNAADAVEMLRLGAGLSQRP